MWRIEYQLSVKWMWGVHTPHVCVGYANVCYRCSAPAKLEGRWTLWPEGWDHVCPSFFRSNCWDDILWLFVSQCLISLTPFASVVFSPSLSLSHSLPLFLSHPHSAFLSSDTADSAGTHRPPEPLTRPVLNLYQDVCVVSPLLSVLPLLFYLTAHQQQGLLNNMRQVLLKGLFFFKGTLPGHCWVLDWGSKEFGLFAFAILWV